MVLMFLTLRQECGETVTFAGNSLVHQTLKPSIDLMPTERQLAILARNKARDAEIAKEDAARKLRIANRGAVEQAKRELREEAALARRRERMLHKVAKPKHVETRLERIARLKLAAKYARDVTLRGK